MPVREQQRPAVGRAVRGELVDALARAGVEREVVQAGPEPVVVFGGHGRRLLDDQVRVAETPAAAVRPVLEGLVTEPAEQPAPLLNGAAQVGHPQLDVVQAPGGWLVHGSTLPGPLAAAASRGRGARGGAACRRPSWAARRGTRPGGGTCRRS